MKRLFCLFFAALLLMQSGCSSAVMDPVSFYYCRDAEHYQYFSPDGVIAPEERDLTGHRGDLRYLVGLYLAGPMEEGMVCPFPAHTQLLSARKIVNSVRIELSDLSESMTDAQFSLAGTCLSMTCMSFVSCGEVIVSSGDRSITITPENILLFDNHTTEESPNGG